MQPNEPPLWRHVDVNDCWGLKYATLKFPQMVWVHAFILHKLMQEDLLIYFWFMPSSKKYKVRLNVLDVLERLTH